MKGKKEERSHAISGKGKGECGKIKGKQNLINTAIASSPFHRCTVFMTMDAFIYLRGYHLKHHKGG